MSERPLSRKPDETGEAGVWLPCTAEASLGPALVLKDPYVLDFLDLKDHYFGGGTSRDAILRELESFPAGS